MRRKNKRRLKVEYVNTERSGIVWERREGIRLSSQTPGVTLTIECKDCLTEEEKEGLSNYFACIENR